MNRTLHFLAFVIFVLIFSASNAQNTWTQLPDFSGDARCQGVSFTLDTDNDGIDDKGYIGAGWDSGTNNYNDFWQYDPVTAVWTQLADYGGLGRRQVTHIKLNNVAYMLGGAYSTNSVSGEVWTYNHVNNTWTQKNNLPIVVWGGSAFEINGKMYFALGNKSGSVSSPNNNTKVYEYAPTTDTWLAKNDIPFIGRYQATVIELDTDLDGIKDKVLVGAGAERNGTYRSDMWEYLPASDTWVQKSDMPGTARGNCVYFNIGDKAFAGLGIGGNVSNELFEYEHIGDTWTRMSDHPGDLTLGASAFVLNNEAYVLGGLTVQGVVNQFYKYAPIVGGYTNIHGNVFADGNNDCTLGSGEFILANIPVQAMPGQYLTSTDANGDYTFRVPSGAYSIAPLIPAHLTPIFPGISCPVGGSYASVVVDSTVADTSGFDFGITALPCPRLSVQVGSSSRLRCFYNNTVINYCNNGLATEDSVYITLSLPSFVSITASSHIFTSLGNDEYEFYIGSVQGGECGQIDLTDLVSCTDVNLLGAAACTEVHIFPQSSCLPPDTAWNGANVEISASCLAPSDTIEIVISNTGSNDMADSSTLSISFDGVIGYTENFLLAQGGSYTLLIPSNGATIMAEAQQVAGHPYNFHVVTWVERCRVDTLQGPLFSIIPGLPLGDEYEQYDVECMPVSGSFDPNDKQAQPSGITANNIIPPGTAINYKLRFQNTGNGVAQNVFLVDTLDASLDVASLHLNAASHAYRMELSGQGKHIVTFYFDNIMLPDSNVSQLGSQGFVSFSIAPKSSVALGTVINNNADIYFDFNPPVRTNTVMLTIDNLPIDIVATRDGNVVKLVGINGVVAKNEVLYMFPNPASSQLNMVATFPANGEAEVIIVDLLGRKVLNERFYGAAGSNESLAIDISTLQTGMYVVMMNRNGKLATGKLIKE